MLHWLQALNFLLILLNNFEILLVCIPEVLVERTITASFTFAVILQSLLLNKATVFAAPTKSCYCSFQKTALIPEIFYLKLHL